MIRFLDIRGQGTHCRFAFFDTGLDQIISYNGQNVWDTFDECEDDIRQHKKNTYDEPATDDTMARFKSLCPEWAFKEPTEDEEEPFWGDFWGNPYGKPTSEILEKAEKEERDDSISG